MKPIQTALPTRLLGSTSWNAWQIPPPISTNWFKSPWPRPMNHASGSVACAPRAI
jgi:hypothetical protein